MPRHDFLLQKFEEIVIVSPAKAHVLITTKASPTVIRDAMEKSKGCHGGGDVQGAGVIGGDA